MSVAKKYSRSIPFLAFKSFNHIMGIYKDKKVKPPKDIMSIEEVPYKDNSLCRLNIYSPNDFNKPLPIIIYYHGGGWAIGDKNEHTVFCKILANRGFVVFNVNYTLSTKKPHPFPLFDCIDVANWVYSNSEKYDADKNNIFLCGDSAGAQAAAVLGALCSSEEMYGHFKEKYNIRLDFKQGLKGLGLLCGISDIRTCYNSGFPFIKHFAKILLNTEDVLNASIGYELSVVENITEKFPPSFLTTTELDPLHVESILMQQKMSAKGVKNKMLSYDKSHKKLCHVYQVDQSLQESQECMNQMVEFFYGIKK